MFSTVLMTPLKSCSEIPSFCRVSSFISIRCTTISDTDKDIFFGNISTSRMKNIKNTFFNQKHVQEIHDMFVFTTQLQTSNWHKDTFAIHSLHQKMHSETATRGVLWKQLFLEISQNSQKNTSARASYLIKLQGAGLIKKEIFLRNFKEHLFQHLRTTSCSSGNTPIFTVSF